MQGGKFERLEDARPKYKAVPLQPFLTSLGESATLICKREGKSLLLQNETSLASAAFDAEFTLRPDILTQYFLLLFFTQNGKKNRDN